MKLSDINKPTKIGPSERAWVISKEARDVSKSLAVWHNEAHKAAGESMDNLGSDDYVVPALYASRNAAMALRITRSGDYMLAKEYHKDAAQHHENAAEGHRGYSGRDVRHEEAAQLHDQAAAMHLSVIQQLSETGHWTLAPGKYPNSIIKTIPNKPKRHSPFVKPEQRDEYRKKMGL